jgi:hypothetical protein
MKTLMLSPLAIVVLVLAGCSGGGEAEPADRVDSDAPAAEASPPAAVDEDARILEAVRANVVALESEDLDGAMALIDPDSPLYDSTRGLTAQIFELYDLDYELLELSVSSRSDAEATVHFVQETHKLSGPDFRDNRVEGEHRLRKVDGDWLIYDTRADSIDYLD